VVIYDLQCKHMHTFEGWFSSSDDLKSQLEKGMVSCPVCDDKNVQKIPTASKLVRSSANKEIKATAGKALRYQKQQDFLRKVHTHIEENYEDVGTKFADQALKMHQGELEQKGIRGSATKDQVHELNKAGVEAVPIPKKPPSKNQIN
jgi:hypothetical protein